MPNLLRGTYNDKANAESIMNIKGFTNVTWVPVNSELPENTVVSQSVPAGKMIDITDPIIIEYSNGIPPEKQPVTIQYTIDDLPAEGECTVILYSDEDGYIQKKKADGETSVTFELTGKGKKTYKVFVDGVGQEDLVIDFDEYSE
jgi:beta-lactam-binding protein with PASTA domain